MRGRGPNINQLMGKRWPWLKEWLGVGGIDKYSNSVFLEKILRYYNIPTIGVADLQARLNNKMWSS